MAEFRVAGTVIEEIQRILALSEARFGTLARVRYAVLIDAAMADVAEDPEGPLVKWKRLSRVNVGIYHLEHSRQQVPDPPGRVREPRHALIFRIARDGVIDFIGIVHDSMLLARALRRSLRANTDTS